MPEEDQPRAGLIDEATRGNHHHESADDEKDIDPRRAIVPIYSGRCGIDAFAPCLEGVEKDDKQRCDGAEYLNGKEVGGGAFVRLGCHVRPDNTPAPAKSTTTIQGGIFHTVRSRKPASASAKSRGVKTALVQTGL